MRGAQWNLRQMDLKALSKQVTNGANYSSSSTMIFYSLQLQLYTHRTQSHGLFLHLTHAWNVMGVTLLHWTHGWVGV